MKKPGRNEPCPCGSGKKIKKCCLQAPEPSTGSTFIYTNLDELSNQVPELIRQEKYNEAKEVCQKLLKQYPEQIDGLHRSAELFEAMGDYEKAATYYEQTAKFAEQADGFEKKSVEYFRDKAEQLADTGKE
ncbi:MAG TPA: tetratricopeptide repeat protein [Desulfocapsa sulfexigens]|nr:tetratricopeptide repeat protein [Desulfocapsa sulfexigens]